MRKSTIWFCTLLAVGYANPAKAFLPNVLDILREVTTGRKPGPVEVVLRHRIAVKGTGTVEIDERILREGNKFSFLWSGKELGQPIAAGWERYNYIVGDQTIPSRSLALVSALTVATAEDLREVLIAEQFIRKDHLYQFKPGYVPTGDPQTWEIRENYLRHSDIFLQRMPSGIAIAVVGFEEGAVRKAVFFDRSLKGIRRFEWRDNQETYGWAMDGYAPFAAGGVHPRRLFLEANGGEVISSDVQAVRLANGRALSDFKTAWRQAQRQELASNAEGILKLMLSFR